MKVATSILTADFNNLTFEIESIKSSDYIHLDVMDGHFVPNITLSPDFVKELKRTTKIPLDIHLMVENPENILSNFSECGENDIISVHYESSVHIQKVLSKIHQFGIKTGVALNPGTPVWVIEDLLPDIDVVLIMTVNPGFAGQKLVPSTLDKIVKLKKWLTEKKMDDIKIEVDGNISFENAKKMHERGADIYVAGSSSVFSRPCTLSENLKLLRSMI